MTKNNERSHKLVRCRVTGEKPGTSYRYVEFEHFKLWAYMMSHKHGLQIGDLSLWLWVCEEEFNERETLYHKSPEIIRASRIGVLLFDEGNNFSHLIHRYAASDETPILQKILLSHLNPELIASGNYELQVDEGYCIRYQLRQKDKIVLGLSDTAVHDWDSAAEAGTGGNDK